MVFKKVYFPGMPSRSRYLIVAAAEKRLKNMMLRYTAMPQEKSFFEDHMSRGISCKGIFRMTEVEAFFVCTACGIHGEVFFRRLPAGGRENDGQEGSFF